MYMKKLKGITWAHSRGFTSIVAVSQRYAELHPDIDITWEKRSLQEFADAPVEKLAEAYDLLIIDHPWAGFAAKHKILLPLQEYLSEEYLNDQAENSVGASHNSYNFDGYQRQLMQQLRLLCTDQIISQTRKYQRHLKRFLVLPDRELSHMRGFQLIF
jgi:multiple sugar transport system substrate-binding protein